MWRKPEENKLKEKEWQEEPSRAPIGLIDLVIRLERKKIVSNLFLLQFKFASSLDYFLIVLGVVLALCGGAGGPILMVMFGVIIQVTCRSFLHSM